MATPSYLPELFDDAFKSFEKHIAPVENSRIIFSGKYGMGKTTFLENFFKINQVGESASDKFEVIRLFPVNYSVGTNQDIFRFIKYDILIEFLRKGIDLETLDLELSHYVALYASKKWESIGISVAKVAAAIGKHVNPGVDYIEKILDFFVGQKDSLKKFVETTKAKHDDSKIAVDYLKEMELSDDNPYEESLILKILEKKIKELKKDGTKEVVLVIDDMDRIDPEHIFRILNVFAANFDISHQRAENKFGFDKIILVCDIDNIRGAFHHKYGLTTNFSGYIDKFYSDDVYNFNIVDDVCASLLKLTSHYKIQHVPAAKYSSGSKSNIIFHWLIQCFFKNGSLNLRSLTKFIDRSTPVGLKEGKLIESVNIKITDQDLLWSLMVISKIFGDRATFLAAIQSLRIGHMIDEDIDLENVFKAFLTLATLKDHKLTRNLNSSYTIEATNSEFTYDTSRTEAGPTPVKNVAWKDGPQGEDDRALALSRNLIPLMHQTVLELYSLGFLV